MRPAVCVDPPLLALRSEAPAPSLYSTTGSSTPLGPYPERSEGMDSHPAVAGRVAP